MMQFRGESNEIDEEGESDGIDEEEFEQGVQEAMTSWAEQTQSFQVDEKQKNDFEAWKKAMAEKSTSPRASRSVLSSPKAASLRSQSALLLAAGAGRAKALEIEIVQQQVSSGPGVFALASSLVVLVAASVIMFKLSSSKLKLTSEKSTQTSIIENNSLSSPAPSSVIFVTEFGDCFHVDPDCRGLASARTRRSKRKCLLCCVSPERSAE